MQPRRARNLPTSRSPTWPPYSWECARKDNAPEKDAQIPNSAMTQWQHAELAVWGTSATKG
eukprot:3967993-Pyramimonas_sp.AAC.1